ncbi:hypothetical protein J6590_067946 [Homalodisca vitripennis]|nr:hypothetical protein J6590_067946 [Homalodisca vitripennis]
MRGDSRGAVLTTRTHTLSRSLKNSVPDSVSHGTAKVYYSSIFLEKVEANRRHITTMKPCKIDSNPKPGAKLQEVASDTPPPADSCCDIIAGTNDVAAGQQVNIYQNLERHITSKLRTAGGVVVATLPHRHDLPASNPVNLESARVNSYIEDLSTRLQPHRQRGIHIARDAPQAHTQTPAGRAAAGVCAKVGPRSHPGTARRLCVASSS